MPEWFPVNISTYGGEIDYVFYLILYITGISFILSEALILFFLFKFRQKEGRKALFIRGDKWAQLAWILIPTAVILLLDLGIDYAGARAYEKVKGEIPPSDLTLRVTASQFNWAFTYPGPDDTLGTEDDVTLDNELHVPVDQVVELLLTSEDVIHSFFVPVLRLKQDVVPGREIRAWFEATETGQFEIACAELCGFGHYTMRGELTILSPEEFTEWMNEQ